jgi:hypothetical protein
MPFSAMRLCDMCLNHAHTWHSAWHAKLQYCFMIVCACTPEAASLHQQLLVQGGAVMISFVVWD